MLVLGIGGIINALGTEVWRITSGLWFLTRPLGGELPVPCSPPPQQVAQEE